MRKDTILLTTFGSLGDLHPFLAIAIELKRRGHKVALGAVEPHRPFIEAAGIEFRLIRTTERLNPDKALMAKVLHVRNGPEYIIRRLVMPALRMAYADTMAAAADASLLVAHPLTFVTRLAAEKLGVPWASTQLAPMGFLSPHDPPSISGAAWLEAFRPLGQRFHGAFFALARSRVRVWTAPIDVLRRELSLPPVADPMFAGSHSPRLVLALFSELLATCQPDWPAHTVITGFPFFDGASADGGTQPGLSPALEDFLRAGEPPVVFTLGSSAVFDPGSFYAESAGAAQLMGRRAVLLTGPEAASVPKDLPASVIACAYAPHSLLFPRAAAVVHQGGVGTTAQAMRAGVPQLVMPYSVDQPDNAARVIRLGLARTVRRKDYTAASAARHLGLLLGDAQMGRNAHEVATRIRAEHGASTACDALEKILG